MGFGGLVRISPLGSMLYEAEPITFASHTAASPEDGGLLAFRCAARRS